MRMTPRNIVIMAIAMVLGIYLGTRFQMIGMVALIGALGFVLFVLLGNKQGTRADPAMLADALAIKPTPGMARIYVMRKGFMAAMQGMNITVDDQFSGQIRSGYFMMAEVTPGEHHLTAKFSKQTASTLQKHTVELQAGDVALFNMSFDMGLMQGIIQFEELRDKLQISRMLPGMKMVGWLKG